ncbi:DUF7286 family protein [Halosimplex amylolyticum]|uniref:DUF7286 family protein n=1 Tax=Halosimplex amylolyticum TaxID=3396616 RepID=UPI003F573CBB
MSRKRPRTISIGLSDRARIPFAIVGVLVLITSVTVVGVMQSRDDPQTESSVAQAMNQAESAAQSTIREAVSDAANDAAKQPVTVPADTPAGRVLAGSSGDPDPNQVYRRYVKLRIYLEIQDQLDSSVQRMSGGEVTRTSLPHVSYTESSIEDAIDRVDLTAGMDDQSDDISNGTVVATIDGVTTEVVENGEVRASETDSVTVSVASTSLLLQERTQKYQDKLSKGFFESGEGYGKQFAARLYPLMYAKAYYERMAPPSKAGAFEKMVMKKDIEVLANSANFAVQGEVFGTRDPGHDRVMASAYACMVVRNVEKLYDAGAFSRSSSSGSDDDYSQGAGGDSLDDEGSTGGWKEEYGLNSAVSGLDAKDFCRAAAMITGGASGDPPDSVQDVVNQFIGGQAQRAFNKKSTVEVEKFAEPAFDEVNSDTVDFDSAYSDDTGQEQPSASDGAPELDDDLPTDFTGRNTFERLIDRIFSYSVSTSTGSASKVSGSFPDATAPSGSGWTEVDDGGVSVDHTVDVSVDHEEVWSESTDRTRDLHEFTVRVTNELKSTSEYRREVSCSDSGSGSSTDTPSGPCYEYEDQTDYEDVTWEIDVTVSGTYSDHPNINVTHNGTDGAYEGSGPNFEEAIAESISAGLNVDPSDPDGNFGSAISTGGIKSAGDLESAVSDQISGSATIDADEFFSGSERSDLRSDLEDEVEDLHDHVVGDDSGPPEEVSDMKVSPTEMATGDNVFAPIRRNVTTASHVYYDTSGAYDSAREKAIAEARMEYVDSMHRWIDRVESSREESSNDVDDEISSRVDGATNVLNQGLDFASDQIDGEGPTYSPGSISDTDLLGDIRYEVSASPTYLTTGPVSRATVPGLRPGYATVTDVGDTQHIPMAVRKHNTFGYPGVPVIPWPSYWYLSIDFWNVKTEGEYGRFEVTANNSAPASPKTTTYVRQEMPVDLEIAGQERRVGQVTPINFSSETAVVIPVPGGTVYPKPNYGVGDRWTIKNPRDEKPWRNMCSASWPHTGPGFRPSAINEGACSNINTGGGPLKASLWDYVPGSDSVSELPLTLDDDGDELELAAPETDDCEEEDFVEALDDDAETWYDGLSEDAQVEIWKWQYCRLHTADYRTQYANFVNGDEPNEDDDDVLAASWRGAITSTDIEYRQVKRTLNYLNSEGGSLSDSESLIEKHDVVRFRTATNANSLESGVDPHKTPGIVTKLQLVEDHSFARVYGNGDEDGLISGSYVARPGSVIGKDREQLVQDFALWNASVVPERASVDPWGNYQCLGKLVVEEDIEVSVSTTSTFHESEHPITETLDGGHMQFKLHTIPDDSQWIPLGRIEYLASHTSEFSDRYEDADPSTPDDEYTDGKCSDDIYYDGS